MRLGLRAVDVAGVLDVSRARVAAIEAVYRVRPETAARYLAALIALDNSRSDTETAGVLSPAVSTKEATGAGSAPTPS